MNRGTLSWYDFNGGYGHVLGEDSVKYIVHRRSLATGYLPAIGDRVAFVVRNVPAGKLAADVRRLPNDDAAPPLEPAPPAVTGAAPPDIGVNQARKSTDISSARPITIPPKAASQARPSPSGTGRALPERAPLGRAEAATEREDDLAKALLCVNRGDEKKAREYFERGLVSRPTPQLITAYASFERNRSRSPNAARDVLKRGLGIYAAEPRIRAHLLMTLGHLELRARQADVAVACLSESLSLAGRGANTGEQYRLLALAHAGLSSPNLEAAWAAVEEAVTRGVNFSGPEVLQLLPCLFGGSHTRVLSLLAFLKALSFTVVSVGERLDNRLVHRPPQFLTLFVQAPAFFSSTYGLGDDLLLVCHLNDKADYAVVTEAEQRFDYYRRNANVNPNEFLFVFQDLSALRQQLLRRAEKPGKPIIIPIDDAVLTAARSDPQAANRELQDTLHAWLFQVDRFRNNQPVSGRNFFGREKVFGSIEAQIEDGRSIGIFGLRKIGKTSILQQLGQRRPVDIVGYVDLQALPPGTNSVDYVLWLIGNELARDAQSKYGTGVLSQMSLFGRHVAFPDGPVSLAFDGDLNRLATAVRQDDMAAKARVIVMLDEIERIIPLPGRRGIPNCDEFFGYLRGKAQQNEWFISIVAGANARVVEEPHWQGMDNPVFRFYQPVYLPPLDAAESSEMITTLGRGMGVQFEPNALERINELTGCHPYVVRQLCSLLARTYSERPITLTVSDIDRVGATFALEEGPTFREMFERVRRDFPGELSVLRRLALRESTSLEELASELGPSAHERLGHLCGYCLVHGDSRGRYSVSFPLLREWMNSNGALSENYDED